MGQKGIRPKRKIEGDRPHSLSGTEGRRLVRSKNGGRRVVAESMKTGSADRWEAGHRYKLEIAGKKIHRRHGSYGAAARRENTQHRKKVRGGGGSTSVSARSIWREGSGGGKSHLLQERAGW